jgi:hypothetical protein
MPRLAEIAQFLRASLSFPAVAVACAFLRKVIIPEFGRGNTHEADFTDKKGAFFCQ